MQFLKKILVPFIGVALLAGMGWLVYQQLFLANLGELKDVEIVYVEGELNDKSKVTAECSVAEDNQFCYKDTIWAEKENAVEFEGYAIIEYTNHGDVVMEVTTTTAVLSAETEGVLTQKSTEPSDIFVAVGDSVRVRYGILFDTTSDEATEQIRSEGLELSVIFTNEIGKSATKSFIVEHKN